MANDNTNNWDPGFAAGLADTLITGNDSDYSNRDTDGGFIPDSRHEPLANVVLVHPHCLPLPPTPEQLAAVHIGQGVKIVRSGERFWVYVTSLNPLSGIVNNDLVRTANHGLSYGEHLRFEHSEIIQID